MTDSPVVLKTFTVKRESVHEFFDCYSRHLLCLVLCHRGTEESWRDKE